MCGAPSVVYEDDDAPDHGEEEWFPPRQARRRHVTAALESFTEREKALDRQSLGSARDIIRRRLLEEVVHAQKGNRGEGFILILDRFQLVLKIDCLNI